MQQAVKGGNNKAAAYYEAMANQKVQSMYPNNPKYHTQDQYGSYLNQNSDSYLNYLSGKSKDAYTVDSNTAAMLGNYDKTYQYSQAIRDADKAGDYKKAAVLEYLMNQKIKNENLPYLQQDNYSSYLNGITQSDVNMAKYGVDVSPSGLYYKVQDNGKAPSGLKAGDLVVTNGGTWMITGVNPDGSYSGAVPVDKGTNVSNFTGVYTTPNSTLAAQGVYSEAPQVDASQFQAPTVDPSEYQVQGADVEIPTLTSDAQMPELRQVYDPGTANIDDYQQILQELAENQLQRANNQIDYATNQGVTEYQRALEDALPTYAAQRGQVDLEGSKNARNAALYAEQRGDRGGIGAAQYNALQIARANQINQINTAQNKAASDTARAIADLRAKGEFEKADKLMEVFNNYSSQLMDARKWVQQYNMQYADWDRSLRQDETNYMNQWAELTGKMPDGSNTFAANSAQAQLGLQYAPYTGRIGGQDTLQLRQQNLENRWQAEQNALNRWEAENSARNTFAGLYGHDPLTGAPTSAENQRLVENDRSYAQLYGNSLLNPTLRTLAAQEFDYDKASNDQKMALSVVDQLMSYNSIPPTSLLEQAGIKDKNSQTQIQWQAYLGAVANRMGMQNELGIDPTQVAGYPSTPPGSGSITSGGGVGTTSTGSSSGSSSGGSSSRSSGNGGTPVAQNPTPTPTPTPSAGKDNASTVKAVQNLISKGQYSQAAKILDRADSSGNVSSKTYKSLNNQIVQGQAARDSRNTHK